MTIKIPLMVKLIAVAMVVIVLGTGAVLVICECFQDKEYADKRMEAIVSRVKDAVIARHSKTGRWLPMARPSSRVDLLEKYGLADLSGDIQIMENGNTTKNESAGCDNAIYDICASGFSRVSIRHKPLIIFDFEDASIHPIRIVGYSPLGEKYVVESVDVGSKGRRYARFNDTTSGEFTRETLYPVHSAGRAPRTEAIVSRHYTIVEGSCTRRTVTGIAGDARGNLINDGSVGASAPECK